jgi:valyl-tRNA synthetase
MSTRPSETIRTDMAPQYDPASTESRWYSEWLARGLFHAAPSGREPFCIVMPPPNVTGRLHTGHALTMTLQDVLTRRARMRGFEALWLPGTDHAGIATQVVVERELGREGIDGRAMGRDAFVERVWAWKKQYGDEIVDQLKALGASADWDRLRFTMDPGLSRAVRVAFVRMYEDGLIYRGERIINWCPKDQTALSDSEVEHDDVGGELVTFRYELSDGDGHIDVATTRVETMLGDTGIAVHPSDERYQSLVGKAARHPFDGRELPIVADIAVDPAFGTGAVKVTPAHDPTDFEIAERAGLPRLNVLNADASIADAAPAEFRGVDRYEARRQVLEALRERGLLVAEERPYVHTVGHCYRCGTEVEPWLMGKQWFVVVARLTGPAKAAAEDGRIRFHPRKWERDYVRWLDNLRDWNISRQLWWGHRIPVWYCPNGHEFASIEDPTVCKECGADQLEQDPDVLDTWFSSQLWPFSTLGWPDDIEDLRFFYPTTALVTAYDILYLWVARMIMSGLYLKEDVPFRHVFIHGLVRDAIGRKMGKSMGNVVDPLQLIERHGADAVRLSLARVASEGQDVPFGEEAVEAARHFGNKLWNAARLVFSVYRGGVPELPPADRLSPVQRWLLSRHQACLETVDRGLDEFRFSEATQAIHRFVWSEYCDWALEMEKLRMYEGSEQERDDAASVLAWALERTLRVLHPIMPFVTEEIWQRFGAGDSIVVAPWPEQHPEHADQGWDMGAVQAVVSRVRQFRGDHQIPPRQGLELRIRSGSQRDLLEAFTPEIQRLTGAASVRFETEDGPSEGCARLLLERDIEVLIPVAGLMDVEGSRSRIRKRLEAALADAARAATKLGNPQFTSKAPEDIQAKERAKLQALEREAASLREQLEQIGGS